MTEPSPPALNGRDTVTTLAETCGLLDLALANAHTIVNEDERRTAWINLLQLAHKTLSLNKELRTARIPVPTRPPSRVVRWLQYIKANPAQFKPNVDHWAGDFFTEIAIAEIAAPVLGSSQSHAANTKRKHSSAATPTSSPPSKRTKTDSLDDQQTGGDGVNAAGGVVEGVDGQEGIDVKMRAASAKAGPEINASSIPDPDSAGEPIPTAEPVPASKLPSNSGLEGSAFSDSPTKLSPGAPTSCAAVPTNEPTPVLAAPPTNDPTPALSAPPTNEPAPALAALPTSEPTHALAAPPIDEPTPALAASPTDEPTPALAAPSSVPINTAILASGATSLIDPKSVAEHTQTLPVIAEPIQLPPAVQPTPIAIEPAQPTPNPKPPIVKPLAVPVVVEPTQPEPAATVTAEITSKLVARQTPDDDDEAIIVSTTLPDRAPDEADEDEVEFVEDPNRGASSNFPIDVDQSSDASAALRVPCPAVEDGAVSLAPCFDCQKKLNPDHHLCHPCSYCFKGGHECKILVGRFTCTTCSINKVSCTANVSSSKPFMKSLSDPIAWRERLAAQLPKGRKRQPEPTVKGKKETRPSKRTKQTKETKEEKKETKKETKEGSQRRNPSRRAEATPHPVVGPSVKRQGKKTPQTHAAKSAHMTPVSEISMDVIDPRLRPKKSQHVYQSVADAYNSLAQAAVDSTNDTDTDADSDSDSNTDADAEPNLGLRAKADADADKLSIAPSRAANTVATTSAGTTSIANTSVAPSCSTDTEASTSAAASSAFEDPGAPLGDAVPELREHPWHGFSLQVQPPYANEESASPATFIERVADLEVAGMAMTGQLEHSVQAHGLIDGQLQSIRNRLSDLETTARTSNDVAQAQKQLRSDLESTEQALTKLGDELRAAVEAERKANQENNIAIKFICTFFAKMAEAFPTDIVARPPLTSTPATASTSSTAEIPFIPGMLRMGLTPGDLLAGDYIYDWIIKKNDTADPNRKPDETLPHETSDILASF